MTTRDTSPLPINKFMGLVEEEEEADAPNWI